MVYFWRMKIGSSHFTCVWNRRSRHYETSTTWSIQRQISQSKVFSFAYYFSILVMHKPRSASIVSIQLRFPFFANTRETEEFSIIIILAKSNNPKCALEEECRSQQKFFCFVSFICTTCYASIKTKWNSNNMFCPERFKHTLNVTLSCCKRRHNNEWSHTNHHYLLPSTFVFLAYERIAEEFSIAGCCATT